MFNNSIFNDDSFSSTVQEAAQKAIPGFINTEDSDELFESALLIGKAFKANDFFCNILKTETCVENEKKVIESFQKMFAFW